MELQQYDLLLVEDNASDAEMTIRALRKSNLASRLMHVRDGDEALDFLFSEGVFAGMESQLAIKIILLDLKMSRVNGKEVLVKIKADPRTQRIPVVVLTSSKEDADIEECYQLGANGYVVKPVVFDDFLKCIADIGLYWLIVNEPPYEQSKTTPS